MGVVGRYRAIMSFVLAGLWTSLAFGYSGGSGTAQDPYKIAAAADLIALGNTPGDYGMCFILTADIDLDPNLPGGRVFDGAVVAPDTNDATGWFDGPVFKGVLDGGGHSISHLTIRGRDYLALFGQLDYDATVKNLRLVDVDIVGLGHSIGGVVAYNCGGTLVNCSSVGRVSGGDYVGGLVGYDYWGSLTQCYSGGKASGVSSVGGLIGEISGYSVGVGTRVIRSCSTGQVSGQAEVGGLVGRSHWGSVSRCFSLGQVSGTDNVGGLIGSNAGNVTQSYSAGLVAGSGQDVGGLLGFSDDTANPRVDACFWDTQTSGQTASAGGTGKTTAQMKAAGTFLAAGWDFVAETANSTDDTWWANEGKDYPRLSWQGPVGMVFVDIPGGTFEMGDHEGAGNPDERPVHTVTLTGFQMSKYEVTNGQYAAYLNAAVAGGLIQVIGGVVYASSDTSRSQLYCDTLASSSYSQVEYGQGRFTVRSRGGKAMSDHPVVRVSWYGAKAFCDYYGYRLPTEAQWEYAARGGYHDPYYLYPWGNNSLDCTKANYFSGSSGCNPLNLKDYPYTSPVGYYGPQGAYGLCDMVGNVWEWCRDWYSEGYYGVSPAGNPTGPAAGAYRVLRGGSWSYDGYYCRVSSRGWNHPDARYYGIGFRVSR
jgi:formylglycine-generating enzyme required for sulfatase activity